MATPTVSTVTPDVGYFIGGGRVELIGTNFVVSTDAFQFDYDPADTSEVYSKVPALNPVFPTPPPQSRVKIVVEKGAASFEVVTHVETTTKLWFNMPRFRPEGNDAKSINWTETVDLRITPLDPSGAEIPAEELFITDALTLSIPKTGVVNGKLTSPHSIIFAKLLVDLRAFVSPRAVAIPYVNYEEEGVTVLRPGSSLPTVVMSGPDIQTPRLASKMTQRITLEDGTTAIQMTAAKVRDMVFDVFFLDDDHMHLLDMCNLLETYVQRSQYFIYTIYQEAAEPLQVVSYITFERYPGIDNIPAHLGSSIRQGRARIRITSVPVGFYADPDQNTISTNPEFLGADIIFQTSELASDEQPDNEPGIIEE